MHAYLQNSTAPGPSHSLSSLPIHTTQHESQRISPSNTCSLAFPLHAHLANCNKGRSHPFIAFASWRVETYVCTSLPVPSRYRIATASTFNDVSLSAINFAFSQLPSLCLSARQATHQPFQTRFTASCSVIASTRTVSASFLE